MVEYNRCKQFAENAVFKLKKLVQKGNIIQIQFCKGEKTIVHFPLNVGIAVGTVTAPWAVILAALIVLGQDCHIQVVKTNGEIWKLL